jgi:archaellum biogenesis ATPase FlaH
VPHIAARMAEASDDGRLARAVPRLCARLLDAFGPDSLTGTLAELERYVRVRLERVGEGDPVVAVRDIPLRYENRQVRVFSGNTELDQMCGEGFFKDAIILLTGPSGAGKTLTSLKFLAAGLTAGERCLAFTFDESREQVRRNSAGWGVDLDSPEESGLLRIVCEYPEVASLEDHFIRIRRAIEEHKPDRLVIDTLSALERIVSPRALLDFFIALGALVRQHSITTLLTSAPAGRFTPQLTPSIAGELASTWAAEETVPNVGMSAGPAVVVYNGLLYLFYQSSGDSGQLMYITNDGSSWQPHDQRIPTAVGMSAGPSACYG